MPAPDTDMKTPPAQAPAVLERCPAPFLVIAGSYRCGSTALFRHLGAHPHILPTRFKETGFFMPLSMRAGPPYPLTYGKHQLQQFLSLFDDTGAVPDALHLEATPTYLYVPEAAERIAHALPQARILICLREPVSRLVSWFHTLKLLRQLDHDLDFQRFLAMQTDTDAPPQRSDFIHRAQLHGRYAPYIQHYFDIFGRERVLVVYLSELQQAPRETLARIARFAGIDGGFFDSYDVGSVNAAKMLRYPRLLDRYLALKRGLSRLCGSQRLAVRLGNLVRPAFERRFFDWVSRPAEPLELPRDLSLALERYYLDDARALNALLGAPPPWLNAYLQRQGDDNND